MTVAELIRQLERLPQNHTVMICDAPSNLLADVCSPHVRIITPENEDTCADCEGRGGEEVVVFVTR
jgi:hypothetical protein